MICEDCKKRGKKAEELGYCQDFPCERVSIADLASQEELTTRRGRQLAALDDFQLLIMTNPEDLAAAGAFDN